MTQQQLSEILLELSHASRLVKSEADLRNIMEKYDLLFLGKDFNVIYASELYNTLNKKYGIPVSEEDLNTLIPIVCPLLGMKVEPMKHLTDLNAPVPATYQITLW
jgi:hypothetical protein|nr:MAG TPA: hypothetical protein [Bacteriophage sp.]